MRIRLTLLLILFLFCSLKAQTSEYCWQAEFDSSQTILSRINTPAGFTRVDAISGSFAAWLRNLPLKAGKPEVRLYNGRLKSNQTAHQAIIDIDVGKTDLQQCADAVMRLRAEYFYAMKMYDSIAFNFTSGDRAEFVKWAQGIRPKVNGNKVTWVKSASPDSSYTSFRKYLDIVFTYAGSYSLNQELHKVVDISRMRIGDVFIQGGFPGHVVIVIDMAENRSSGEKLFLLAQGFTPAQDIHVLRNNVDNNINPWYKLDFGEILYTPEWKFKKSELKSFYSD